MEVRSIGGIFTLPNFLLSIKVVYIELPDLLTIFFVESGDLYE
jgi:hypothetical protein